ncbi:hypothetical protein CYMTET_26518 [Cymbomonas tetramitiformis]|uniref:Uncharacterized protein n=1 Tax=Cymbomonas tetramitiformis TaxID=36881 RepID=A0AAE0FS51_9CHLO|nr:hypothetical protein CYMTET_26518 [Cymbomonas tetramitiformis]
MGGVVIGFKVHRCKRWKRGSRRSKLLIHTSTHRTAIMMHTQSGVLLQASCHSVLQILSTSKSNVLKCSKRGRSSSLYGAPKVSPFLLSAAFSKSPKNVKVQTSAEMASARISTKWKLSNAYTDLDSLTYGVGAFVLPDDDRVAMKVRPQAQERSPLQGPKAWTYGEISFEGVQVLS